MTAILFWLSMAIGALWLVALVKPRWVGSNLLGTRSPLTDRSKWMRQQLHLEGLKLLKLTGWLVPVLYLLEPTVAGPWGLTGFLLGSVAFKYLGAFRLRRKWRLWQQLGYDGPPALEAQTQALEARSTRPEHQQSL